MQAATEAAVNSKKRQRTAGTAPAAAAAAKPRRRRPPAAKRSTNKTGDDNGEGRTWADVASDARLNKPTRNLAASFINNRVAHFYNMSRIISLYMEANGIPYRRSRDYTWRRHTNRLYTELLKRSKSALDDV